jgi:C4-dicarboxylate-specific signal transduction histidine kinase
MPIKRQAKVFDPFLTTKSASHGFGLAVIQGIVRTLDGAIRRHVSDTAALCRSYS